MTPADWYCATHTWHDVLAPAGWYVVHDDGEADGSAWRHPDATADQSATVEHDRLFVYSTSTVFEATSVGDPHGYTRFRAFAALNFGGDLSSAARAVREQMGATT